MTRTRLALFVAALVLSSAGATAQQVFWIIVHPQNPAAKLTTEEASRLFLRKDTRWPDGVGVEPVDLVGTSALRQSFSDTVHGRSTARIQTYWQQKIFSGELTPPPEVGSEDEVLEFVRSNRGAVGYVSADCALDGVRRISLTIPPRRLTRVAPAYPARARAAGIVGDVVLLVSVDSSGRVVDVEVVRGLPLGLNDAAVQAVRKWTYEPAFADGTPVPAQVEVTLHFQP